MFELIKQLIGPVAPSGCECAVANVIERLAAPYGEVSRDALGNVLAQRPGSGKKILAAAHIDSTGVIVTYLEEGGYARFGALGGLKPSILLAQRIRFADGTLGIIRADAGTDEKDLALDKLYIDTAGVPVRIGDVAVYTGSTERVGGLVISPYLDDRIGCAILLEALRQCQGSENDLYFAFTAQEEVGIRGAGPAAFAVQPELGIAVDVCGADDMPGDGEKLDLRLGGGPVVKLMDAGSISNATASRLVEETAQELGIAVQRHVATRGGTDAKGIQSARSGAAVAQISISTRYTHSTDEIAHLGDAVQCAALLAAVMQK